MEKNPPPDNPIVDGPMDDSMGSCSVGSEDDDVLPQVDLVLGVWALALVVSDPVSDDRQTMATANVAVISHCLKLVM